MTVALYTNIISPHQLPLAREIVRRIGKAGYRYVYTEDLHDERTRMGWASERPSDVSCLKLDAGGEALETEEARQWLERCDVLLCCFRDLALIERRSRKGLRTYYVNERWFKPPLGYLRMLVPSFRRMAKRFVSLTERHERFRLLPIGVHACHDFRRLGVRPDKMTTWGYFVEASQRPSPSPRPARSGAQDVLRILWVGRLLAFKRVDTLFKAVNACQGKFPIELTVAGDGPMRCRLERLAQRLFGGHPGTLSFQHSVPIEQVRALMQSHDVYVLTSNGYEGWGAVVSEAIEEGMTVFGTYEAGSCATILPDAQLFSAGDWRRLSRLLEAFHSNPQRFDNGGDFLWTAARAAERLLSCTL